MPGFKLNMLVKGAPGNNIYVIPLPVFMVSLQIECPATILARYVAIGLLTLNQPAYLMLQEVEVYAVPGELKWTSVMIDIKYKGWYKIADILQKILASVNCYSLPQKYEISGMCDRNTHIWHFYFLEMAWHQTQTNIVVLMQFLHVVLWAKNTIYKIHKIM